MIVVLGAALTPDGRDLGPALAERVRAGAEAFLAGLAPRVIVTGVFEAELMRRRAVSLGVPASAILTEPTARSTRENALASSALMREHQLASALVVTQKYHRRRSVAAFRRAGVAASAHDFPCRPASLRQLVREAIALVAYRTCGWLA